MLADETETSPGPSLAAGGIRRTIAVGTLSQVGGRLVAGLGSVLALRLVTHHFGPASWGVAVAATAWVSLLSRIADLGLGTYLSREVADQQASPDRVVASVLGLRLALGAGMIPLAMGGAWILYGDNPAVRLGVLALSPVFLTDALTTTLNAVFVGSSRVYLKAMLDVAASVASVVIALVVISFGLDLEWYLLATGAGSCIVAFMAVGFVRRSVRLRIVLGARHWGPLLVTVGPLALIEVANMVYFHLDSVILSFTRPMREVALYGIAYRAIEAVMAIPSFFMLAMFPLLVGATGQVRQRLVQRSFDSLAMLAAPTLVLGIFVARPIVVAMSGPQFRESATPLAILMVGAVASFGSAVFGNSLVAAGLYRSLGRVLVPVMALNIFINVVAAPRFGPPGAAAAMAASEVLSLLLVWRLHGRLLGATPSLLILPRVAGAAGFMALIGLLLEVCGLLGASLLLHGAMEAAVLATAYALALVVLRLRPLWPAETMEPVCKG